MIVLAAFVPSAQSEREKVRKLVGADRFIGVYCCCPLQVCESRDKKGNYAKARAGLIPEFAGISAPYQEPENPDLIIDTNRTAPAAAIAELFALLQQKSVLAPDEKSHV